MQGAPLVRIPTAQSANLTLSSRAHIACLVEKVSGRPAKMSIRNASLVLKQPKSAPVPLFLTSLTATQDGIEETLMVVLGVLSERQAQSAQVLPVMKLKLSAILTAAKGSQHARALMQQTLNSAKQAITKHMVVVFDALSGKLEHHAQLQAVKSSPQIVIWIVLQELQLVQVLALLMLLTVKRVTSKPRPGALFALQVKEKHPILSTDQAQLLKPKHPAISLVLQELPTARLHRPRKVIGVLQTTGGPSASALLVVKANSSLLEMESQLLLNPLCLVVIAPQELPNVPVQLLRILLTAWLDTLSSAAVARCVPLEQESLHMMLLPLLLHPKMSQIAPAVLTLKTCL